MTNGIDRTGASHQPLKLPPTPKKDREDLEGVPVSFESTSIKLGERFDQGGYGDVYKTNRDGYVVKIVDKHCADEMEEVASEALKDLSNVIAILDKVIHGDKVYYLMKEAPGESLKKLFHSSFPPPPEFCLEIMAQVAIILRDIHEAGFVYRDLKPDNIMVEIEKGVVTVNLIDLGFAFPANNIDEAKEAKGTCTYMDPQREIATTDQERKSADIWSFGCLFFEVMTNQNFLSGDTPVEVLAFADSFSDHLTLQNRVNEVFSKDHLDELIELGEINADEAEEIGKEIDERKDSFEKNYLPLLEKILRKNPSDRSGWEAVLLNDE